MAQIRESRFAVGGVNERDIDLVDFTGGGLVTVETEHRYYSDDFEQEISRLSEGDILNAQIQGEDILQPNAIWRFLEFEVLGNDPGWEL